MRFLTRSFLLSAAALTVAAGCTGVPKRNLPAQLRPSKDYRYKIDKPDEKTGSTTITYHKKSMYCVGGFRESLLLKVKNTTDTTKNNMIDPANITFFKFVKKKFYSLDYLVKGNRLDTLNFAIIDYKENYAPLPVPAQKAKLCEVPEVTRVLPQL